MDTETLIGVGFTEREANIYINLLKRGLSSASQIGKDLGYDRTTTYYAILNMMDKGFATSIINDNKRYFSASEPKNILNIIKQREEDFQGMINKLESLRAASNDDVKVEVLKGKTGLNRLFKDIIDSRQELIDFGVDENKFLEYGALHFDQYLKYVNTGDIKERLLTMKGTKLIGKRSRYRFVEERYFSAIPTIAFGDKVGFIIWEPSLHIILIENRQLSKSFKKRFELLWKIGTK